MYITERLFVQGLPVKRMPAKRSRLTSEVGPPKSGSWEALIYMVIGVQASAYAPEIREANEIATKWFWDRSTRLLKIIFSNIENVRDTKMLADILLDLMLEDIKYKFGEFDLSKTIRLLVDAIQDFSEPLERSAFQLYLSHMGSEYKLDQSDRDAIVVPLPDPYDIAVTDPYLVPVKIVRLNIKTGRGLINFVETPETQKHCIIEDPIVFEPKNPYGQSFSDQTWLLVEAEEVASSESGRQNYFRILSTSGLEYVPETLL